jgi:hypothetical protein
MEYTSTPLTVKGTSAAKTETGSMPSTMTMTRSRLKILFFMLFPPQKDIYFNRLREVFLETESKKPNSVRHFALTLLDFGSSVSPASQPVGLFARSVLRC